MLKWILNDEPGGQRPSKPDDGVDFMLGLRFEPASHPLDEDEGGCQQGSFSQD
jgi:hypothetical protein